MIILSLDFIDAASFHIPCVASERHRLPDWALQYINRQAHLEIPEKDSVKATSTSIAAIRHAAIRRSGTYIIFCVVGTAP